LKIRWSGPARHDLVSSHAFLDAHNRRAAWRYAGDIRRAVNRLAEMPRLGAPMQGVPLQGEFRSIVVQNHRVIYRVDDEAVTVFRVWDCRQDPAGMWGHWGG
jgi:plasmid stabilization system protein ParE